MLFHKNGGGGKQIDSCKVVCSYLIRYRRYAVVTLRSIGLDIIGKTYRVIVACFFHLLSPFCEVV